MAPESFPLVYDGTGEPPTLSPWGACGRNATLAAVATLSKLWLTALNRTTCQGCERFQELVTRREAGRPLITVSNHASTLDDPTLFCAMLPLRLFATESQHGRVRWTLCANDLCHQNRLLAQFFLSGKTLPIVRGAGREQPILALMSQQLRTHGDWLHLFPEGRVRQDGQMNPLKTGLAHVLCDLADTSPIVLPFHHAGMQDVMRVKTSRPRANNRVHIVVGEPVQLADLLLRCRKKGEDQQRLAREIMERVSASLEGLRVENERTSRA